MAGEPQEPPHRFGEIALEMGLIGQTQLDEALGKQEDLRRSGARSRLGETFMILKVLDLEQVRSVLAEQRRRRKHDEDQALPMEQFGEFKLVRRIGEGGMGVVFEARDVLSGRQVALKVLRKGLGVETTFIKRFDRELKAAEKLEHPNLVETYRAGVLKGIQYLAMEYVDGETLKNAIAREGAVEEPKVLRAALEVARALQYAHAKGFLHRDIKPENVLLAKDGGVKLADLGLAKSVYGDQRVTRTGEIVGTPHYISPEQAEGLADIDARSDLYSLGATMYHALTGQLPFDAASPLDVMLLHIKGKLAHPQDLNPKLSDPAVQVVMKLMARRREDRYPNAGLLAEDLEAVLAGKPPPNATMDFSRSQILPPKAQVAARPKGRGCLGVLLLALGALTILAFP